VWGQGDKHAQASGEAGNHWRERWQAGTGTDPLRTAAGRARGGGGVVGPLGVTCARGGVAPLRVTCARGRGLAERRRGRSARGGGGARGGGAAPASSSSQRAGRVEGGQAVCGNALAGSGGRKKKPWAGAKVTGRRLPSARERWRPSPPSEPK
jgi:hypothetical protein